MRLGVILIALIVSFPVYGFCPFSQALLGSLRDESAITLYKNCAEGMNDDVSQARLAKLYDQGTTVIPRDLKKALYYYQLSADNGNAESQARLAQLYMELDKDRNGRAELHSYLNTIVPVSSGNETDDFKGELVHPYVLLMLANDNVANKWYYPTTVKKAPTYAANLYRNYKIDKEKKQQLLGQARAWKKRKILEMARQVLSKEEYQEFSNTLYPANGQADSFKRSQLLKDFQKKVEMKQQQDQESAKAFY
ncbi:MAG: SEL1-like repeat protein [Alphaproteobacteria bacterium]|nr:SEL1-like repeat protein [Alphaproteobacteria bacterium]